MRWRIGITVISLIALLAASLASPGSAAAQGTPHCPPGQAAQFLFGIGELRERLGPTMGAPIECEHVNPENGDTIQNTTTGLAYYRPEINTPMFTDGQTHWALSQNQVIMWRNGSVVPPRPTAAESSYLETANSLARNLDVYQQRIATIQQQARTGRLDAVDVGDVGALYDELSNARSAMAQAPPSDRLAAYDGMLIGAHDQAVMSAELLLRARLTDIPEARTAFIDEAAARVAESNRLQGDAANAYSLALPVVVG